MTLDMPTRPIEELEARLAAPAPPDRGDVVGPRVLLVDDNAELAASLAISLSEEGVTAKCVTSAKGAKAVFESERFDALVIDLVMPGTHGMALLLMEVVVPPRFKLPQVGLSGALAPAGEIPEPSSRRSNAPPRTTRKKARKKS